MVIVLTKLNVADNAGAYEVKCIKVLGIKAKNVASIGDIIVVVIKRINTLKKRFKKGLLRLALVVRTKLIFKRGLGVYLKFADNAVIMMNRKMAPLSKRLKGPLLYEICVKYKFIVL